MHHHLWLWLWFLIGAHAYIAKRAFYMIKGPNPAASTIKQYIHIAGVPIGFRLLVDSGIYWACFSPEVLQAAFKYFGWETAAAVVAVVTRFAVCALFFGLAVDPLMDWAIPTLVGKIPFLKDWWPQMPGPIVALPKENEA